MGIRVIDAREISAAVSRLCVEANMILPRDVKDRLETASDFEPAGLGNDILCDIMENYRLAEQMNIPVCQDTGTAVVFLDIGQDVHISGGDIEDAVNAGVSDGYLTGLLRCSVVNDPLRRKNTEDNTPAVIHTRIVPGDKVMITVAPKGAGSENMSAIKMLTPSAGRDDIINYVVECVKAAGSNPCPPVIVGVGIGGNFEKCAELAKRALCRSTDIPNRDEYYQKLEMDILEAVNLTDIGPQGFGGKCTALAINIETFATHIASLPVAVNMGCHVTRHSSVFL